MGKVRSKFLVLPVLFATLAACNPSGGTTPPTTGGGGGGGGGGSSGGGSTPTPPSGPTITMISPYDYGGDAYFSAGPYLYSVSLTPASGTSIQQVSTSSITPAAAPISLIKPYGNTGATYVAAGANLYTYSPGASLQSFGSVPTGSISHVEPFGQTGDVFVASGSVLYVSISGSALTQAGASTDGAPISQVLPYDNSGDAYVSAGSNLYNVAYSSSTGTFSMTLLASAPASSSGGAPATITQILLVPNTTNEAYVAAGSAVYSTSLSPLSLVGNTASSGSGGTMGTLSTISEMQLIGTSQSIYIEAGLSLYKYTNSTGFNFVDTASLASGLPGMPLIVQLFGQNGNAYVAVGATTTTPSALYTTNGTTLTLAATAQSGTVISQLALMDPAGDAYFSAGAYLYAYIAGTPSPVGDLNSDGTPNSNPNIPTPPTPPSSPTPPPCSTGAASAFVANAADSDSASLRTLPSHRPRALRSMVLKGKLDETLTKSITIALPLNNEAALDKKLATLYDPSSKSYHRFLTRDQFRKKYAPTDAQVNAVKSYLSAHGITPSLLSANRTLLHATAKVGAINSAFHTELHQYTSADGKSYFAPDRELQVDPSVPIRAVLGVHNLPMAHKQAISAAKAGTSPSAAVAGLYASGIREAYNTPISMNGAGQTLALFELDAFNDSDISGYESQMTPVPNVPVKAILLPGANTSPGTNEDEVVLDIEMMIALAPGASQINVYEGPNTDDGIVAVYDQIASDDTAEEVSSSWNSDESDASLLQSESTAFKQMAAQGQSMFASSGDSGADFDPGQRSVADPASQPYVVGVGGTTLSADLNNNVVSYVSESTWGTSKTDASGGGISQVWTIPSWQNGFISSASGGSQTMRNVPDVALDADPNTGYWIYLDGQWQEYGGTSAAAPLWAAFTALVNQGRTDAGLGSLGFLNPALYAIAASPSNYAADFHDITTGGNFGFSAVPGYDDTTGLGSYNGQSLFNDLVNGTWGATSCGTN